MKRNEYRNLMEKKSAYVRKHRKLMLLQMFAEGGESGDSGSGSGDGDGDGAGSGGMDGGADDGGAPDKDAGGKGGKDGDDDLRRKYSDAEVDRIVAKHRAKWEKEHSKEIEAAKDEARKYERMSKEQREEADRKKAAEEAAAKDKRIAELERRIALDDLRKDIASDVEDMPEGFVPSQDFLDLVVPPDADGKIAQANVKKLCAVILADRKAQEEKRARGTTPKSYSGGEKTLDPYQAIREKYKKMKGR